MSTSWVVRFKYETAKKASSPGIYRLRTGGYLVRAKHGVRILPDADLPEAKRVRAELSNEPTSPSTPLWREFAASLFEERVLKGEISSASTRDRWHQTLVDYLIPAFGHFRVDELHHRHVVEWTTQVARWIVRGKPSLKDPKKNTTVAPTTANGWLRVLKTICAAMTVRHDLPRDPCKGVSMFPEGRIYGPENPNSLDGELVRKWLELAAEKYPQHYAMLVLGFVTGRRPGELRALRRHIDVLWTKNQILIRRSHSRRQEVKDSSKTGPKGDLVLHVPQEVMDILRDHIKALPPGPMRNSELLFPGTHGGIRSRSGLDKPFAAITKALNLPFKVTPRAMRRSFNDLAREAGIGSIVKRSISGHATEEMAEHYSTVRGGEQREAVAKIVRLVK